MDNLLIYFGIKKIHSERFTMKMIKSILLVFIIGFLMFALDSIISVPVSSTAIQVIPSDYTALACLVLPSLIAIALVSVISGSFAFIKSKLIVIAALIYILYGWLSVVFFPPYSLHLSSSESEVFLIKTVVSLVMIIVSAPMSFFLAELAERVRRKIINRNHPC